MIGRCFLIWSATFLPMGFFGLSTQSGFHTKRPLRYVLQHNLWKCHVYSKLTQHPCQPVTLKEMLDFVRPTGL